MPRSGRLAPVALALAVVLGGLAAWLLLRDGELPFDPSGSEQGGLDAAQHDAPRLLGAAGPPEERDPDGATRAVPAPGEEPAGDVRKKAGPQAEPESVRVLDARGRPVYGAQITVLVRTDAGEVSASANTQRNGTATLRRPAGTVVALTVKWSRHVLLSRKDAAGIDLGRLGDVRSEELLLLQVRTVDPAGAVRPAQRVFYRPLEEGKTPTGWWGATSDAEGWVRLGPYEPNSRMELRAGPRGLEHENVNDPDAWQAVVVDGTDVEVVVGELPRLRLAFPGTAPAARLEITVLDMDTGKPVFPTAKHQVKSDPWTAEALSGQVRLEVVVFDARNGRFARMRDVLPAGLPIDVELEQGTRFSGRVVTPGAVSLDGGSVTVTGRGFQASTRVDRRGRFRFRGLPDEALRFSARVTDDDEGGMVWLGQAERTRERHVDIPVGRLVRVTGRLNMEAVTARGLPLPAILVSATSPDWAGTRALTVYATSPLRFELPAGRWRLSASAELSEGRAVEGTLDLGQVDVDRKDVVLVLQPAGR